MQRSPCHECINVASDKNIADCLNCAKRTAYVVSLEGRSGPVPMEMTDMGSHNPEKTRRDDQFLRDNPDMPPGKIAAELGRTLAAVNVRRSRLKLTRAHAKADLRAKVEAGHPSFSDAPEAEEAPAPAARSAASAVLTPSKDLLVINAQGFEDLYERLKRSAKENFRTPELQALWFIYQALQAEDGA